VCHTVWASVTQHPPVHHPKTPVLGFHGWDETVPKGPVYMVSTFYFLLSLFFPHTFFSPAACFFLLGHPWPHIIFWQLLPNPLTYLLPCLPPTHLPPSPCFFLPHSLLFRSPLYLVLEKQGQFELVLRFTH
jgi:hypothetical protein